MWTCVVLLQFWRLITNFLFFGASFSLDFVFHMFFLYASSPLPFLLFVPLNHEVSSF
jgi:hypothetical protein